jgi:ribosomal protein L37AE/L43A
LVAPVSASVHFGAAVPVGARHRLSSGKSMASEKGPNIKKKQKCKNCEGKGLLKKGDKVVKCQRCGGTGLR